MPTTTKLFSSSKKNLRNSKNHDSDDSQTSSDCDDYESLSDESFCSEENVSKSKTKKETETAVSVKENKASKKNKKKGGLILVIENKKSNKFKENKKKDVKDLFANEVYSSDEETKKEKDEEYNDEDKDEDEDEDDDDYEYETDDTYEYYLDDLEQYDSETEKKFMKELFDYRLEKSQNKFYKNNKSKTAKSSEEKKKKQEVETPLDITAEYKQLQDTKRMLFSELKKRPKNKICKNAVESCNRDIQTLLIKQKKSNFKRFHDLLYKERENLDENKHFIEKLSHHEQLQVIEKMEKYQQINLIQTPYRFRILESNISENLKGTVLQKISRMDGMETCDQEYHKIKTWVDTFMKIPFGQYKNTLVNLEKDGIDSSNDFMVKAQTVLDECTYGLKEAKLQIMQMLGNWVTNPSAMGTAIAIKGPPGTGKTSLVKEGVSKILGRDFVFIPLGGAGDGSFLEGHSYTYEGSTWGKIVQSLIDCRSMNPVFYFDELDKVSESQRGQEIINILIHMTDTSQNNQFMDKYFTEINELDISKCLFIFSFNDESKVNPILLNRMHVIHTKGYNIDEKLIIGKNYLLPKIRQQINIPLNEIVLTDEIMKTILNSEHLCKKEDGVRNFKRALEVIFSKLNLYRVMKPDSILLKQYPNMPSKIEFPYTVTKSDLEIILKNNEITSTYQSMYV